jgi:hypothetical protein
MSSESTFTMLLVKKQNQWLIDNVRETELPPRESHYDRLKDLEWLVGEWTDRTEGVEVRTVCEWVANKNFLNRSYTVRGKDGVEFQGTQVIGWDPLQQRIRSWVFDSDGTFGDGVWKREGKRWTIKAAGVLPDGKRSTATQIITRIDDNKYTWEAVSRSVDGQVLPNVAPVAMVRENPVKGAKTGGNQP